MDILDPKNVKKESSETAEQSRQRTFDAAAEESRIIKRLNLTRQESEKEKEKIRVETDAYVKKMEAKREVVRLEVSTLESKRKEAMRPVSELHDEAKERIVAVEIREKELTKKEDIVKAERAILIDRLEGVNDANAEVNARKVTLDKREENIKKEESALKKTSKELAEKWVQYYRDVAKANDEMVRRERIVKDMTKSNEGERSQLDKIRKNLTDKDRAITDKYKNLLMASEEFEKQKEAWQTQKQTTIASEQP